MKIAILSRNPRLYSTRRLGRSSAGARTRGPGDRRVALLHEHHLACAVHPLSRAESVRLRRGDSAHRRVGHLLRHRGGAPVRDDGRLPAERVRRHLPLARQAALAAIAVAQGHRPADYRLRPCAGRYRRPDQDGRRRAAGDQAAGRHPGHRCRARRDPAGGRERDRGLHGAEGEHPGAGIHQGGQRGRYPLFRHRRQGGRGHEATGEGGRVPFQPAPRRHCQPDPHHPGGTLARRCARPASWA